MQTDVDFQHIAEKTEDLHNQFHQIVQPYRSALWRYCLLITGSPWDAEDLLQETLLKAFASLGRIKQAVSPKSYLFRMATNTWLDQCRKNKLALDSCDVDDEVAGAAEGNTLEIREALELLVRHLPPRQAVVLLLIDVFRFTAREAAEIICSTEGAVTAALFRARAKVASLRGKEFSGSTNQRPTVQPPVNPRIIEAYMKAFVAADFTAIGSLLADHAENEVVGVGIDIGKARIRQNSMGDWMSPIPGLHAEASVLWGKPVVVFTVETAEGPKLWDVTCLEIENDQIVRHRSHYFCKDLLTAAAQALGIPLEESKHLYGFPW
jgi:RNA polymerase sigma factor (sigma-70 family)